MFPHNITLYNVVSRVDPSTLQTVEERYITILRGVLIDPVKASPAGREGYTGADKVTVYIPFGVQAVDGVGANSKRYVSPREFAAAEDKDGLWTLTTDGKTFFMKDIVVSTIATRQQLEQEFEVYNVTSVAQRDFGPEDMKHWEIGGA